MKARRRALNDSSPAPGFILHPSAFILVLMRVRLIWVGKTRDEHLRALAGEYLKRLRRYAKYEVAEVREGGSADERACLEEEGKRITASVASDALTVLLDVGGHLGVSEDVRRRADVRWSLSRLTLTHEMARVVLVEQLYRAYTILRGVPYQK